MDPHLHIESSVQLMVEGNDQRNFFEAFARHLGIGNMQVQDFGGVNEFSDFISNLAAEDDFRDTVHSIGIVRDAERSAQSAFQSIQSSLLRVGLPVPSQPAQTASGYPSISVFILPDNSNSGMLETLLCQTFQDDPIGGCVDDFLTCARSAGGEDLRNPDKSRAHAFLSTMPRPEVSVGVAARRSYWNLDHPAFDEIRAFLRTL